MAFEFDNPWAGGALGKLGKALEAVYAAIKESGGEGSIRVKHEADGSMTIKYLGRDAKNGWNGIIVDGDDPATSILEIDVRQESNIQGKYICVDPETGDHVWADTPSDSEGWKSYHVADTYKEQPAGMSGAYHLNRNYNGTIVMGGKGPARPLVENNILSAEEDPEAPGELKWTEGELVIEADAESAGTGFEFAKPDPDDIDAHSQMTATGGLEGDVLSRTATGAAWATPDTAPWPVGSSISVVTGVTPELIVSGSTLTVKLTVASSTIDFNAKTITPDANSYWDDSVDGGECD